MRKNTIEQKFSAKIGFYSLKSKSLDFYNLPFQATGDTDALNRVASTINNDSMARANAHDMEVYRIGIFDPATGIFDGNARLCICDNVLSIPSIVTDNTAKEGEENE